MGAIAQANFWRQHSNKKQSDIEAAEARGRDMSAARAVLDASLDRLEGFNSKADRSAWKSDGKKNRGALTPCGAVKHAAQLAAVGGDLKVVLRYVLGDIHD